MNQSSKFSVHIPGIFIYKFCKKENLIQPSGEPRGQRTSILKFDMDSFFVSQLYPGTIIYIIILFNSSDIKVLI